MIFPGGRAEDHQGVNGKRRGYIFWHLTLPLDFVAFHSFPPKREGKSKAKPKQSQCARKGRCLSTVGTKAPSHLFAWSSALQQAQGVLLEPARCLRSAPSLSYWWAAVLRLVPLLPSPCVCIQPGCWRQSGGTRQGKVFPLCWDLLF